MDIKEFVIANVKPERYYKDKFPQWDERARPNVCCPFHSEKKPSFAVALDRGGAKCWSTNCGKKIGNIVHFEAELTGLEEDDAARVLYDQYVHRIYPSKELKRTTSKLLGSDSILRWVKADTGLTPETCKAFSLGWDDKINRLTIPIEDRFGNVVNCRNYQLPRHRTAATKAKIYNTEGYGYLELFPWQSIKEYTPEKPVYWMKAERDTMLAIQMGLQAFCLLNGEDSFLDEVLEIFEDYDVAICGDNDAGGIKAAEKRFALLQTRSSGKFACNLSLPFSKSSSRLKDFSDWVIKDKGTRLKITQLFQAAKRGNKSTSSPSPSVKLQLPTLYSNEFQELINIGRRADMLNKVVKVRGIVAAKSDRPYVVPCKFLVSRQGVTKKEWSIPVGRELLRLIRTSDDQVLNFIKRDILGDPKCTLEPLEYVSATEVEVIPVVDPTKDSPYVTQKCVYFGEHIEANLPYELEVIPTNEIRSQEAIGIITKAEPIARTLDTIKFTADELKQLEQFHPEGEVTEGLYIIANDFAMQYSGIYHREDWHIVALLSWFSPLQFEFPHEGLQRGWINTLALGDTQTGKSEVVQKIREVTNGGTFVNAENCTYVGLVGGAVKGSTGQFMLRWGKIPLNNRQLVVIEELSGLTQQEIANMSEVRSSGIARLDKGGLSSETSAKTRLVCLSNVRGKYKNLSGYISGVQAVQELIGQPEDISRFDFICTLTDREVSADVINQPRFTHRGIAAYSRESFRNLLRFVWSLTPEQIEFTEEAYLICLEWTKKLSKVYHPSIPLFKAGSGRMKIARVACAIACFQFAWNGEKIIVKADHVDAAVDLLQTWYKKDSCGYYEYSQQMFHRERVQDPEELDREFNSVLPNGSRRSQVLRYILNAGRFTQDELMQVASLQMYQASKLIGRMVNSNLLRKGEKNVWEVTPVGKPWIVAKSQENPKDEPKLPPKKSKGKVAGGFAKLFNQTT